MVPKLSISQAFSSDMHSLKGIEPPPPPPLAARDKQTYSGLQSVSLVLTQML